MTDFSERLLTVAAAQYPIDQPQTFQDWALKAAQWVADGAETGAKLLVFPEYGSIEIAATGGPEVMADLQRTLAVVADHAGGVSKVWRALAAAHDVFILAPSGPERREGAYVNAARLYGPQGGEGVQEKLILTPFEHAWGMSAGQGQQVFDTPLGRIGVAICYDCEFPLLVRALVDAGAEILLVPSCTEHMSGFHRVRTGAMARALESHIIAVTSPTVGEALWSPAVDRNSGAAAMLAPPDAGLSMNGIIAEGVLNAPCWVRASFDLNKLRRLAETGEMRNRADWDRQRGAQPLGGGVEVVAVR